jgi:hypothetical protein
MSTVPLPVNAPVMRLLFEASSALHLNQRKLAALMGTSLRTVQRQVNGKAPVYPRHLHAVADAVRSVRPDLAAQLDARAPRAAPPAPPQAAPVPPPQGRAGDVPMPVLIDSVVCVAADAMGATPSAIRPALLAAFARAHLLKLAPDAIAAGLAPPEPAKGARAKKPE